MDEGWRMMWWCDDVVMRWRSRIKNMRHWVLCKTTAPIDNATLTDTIFFSPTLKGGKLFIVSCEFWVFLYAKIFFIFIMFLSEQSWRNSFAMKWGGKCVYLSITKFTELWWNDCVFEGSEEHWKLWRCEVEIFCFLKRFFTVLCFVQSDRFLICFHGLKIYAIR